MIEMLNWLVLLISYLLGSIPTALLLVHAVAGIDIRTVGDGNMGARNTSQLLGKRAGMVVALADFCKAAVAVLLMQAVSEDCDWQAAAGAAAVLGHDFPVFAKFRGGQGFAATAGVFFVLMPLPTLVALSVYGAVYLLTRHADLGAGIGMGLLAFWTWLSQEPRWMIGFVVLLLVFIPVKKFLDEPRRHRIRNSQEGPSNLHGHVGHSAH
ncbi:MAG TPA: glycerol-3-phosphate acyltransferase [Anaerolineaceae bacterium]|nr:glycerol-3-phosphate acyltransferase [Anaerolineaceae bacterium]